MTAGQTGGDRKERPPGGPLKRDWNVLEQSKGSARLRVWFYLDSGQHDGDQVVVWEQQGADHAAVSDVLDDSWEGSRRM